MKNSNAVENIIIMGSCASRDAYTDNVDGICYFARSSLISAFSLPFYIPESTIESLKMSPWNQKMLKIDCQSLAGDLMAKERTSLSSEKNSIAIIDLVDERFKVYVRHETAVTASVQFSGINGHELAKRRGYVALSIFDEDHYGMWVRGADKLINCLHKSCKRILLNNVKFSSVDTDGNEYKPDLCSKFNSAIEPYYKYLIDKHGCNEIHSCEDKFFVDPNHRWGAAPFHYTTDVYKRIRSKVSDESNI